MSCGVSSGWEMEPRDLALVRFPRNRCYCSTYVSHSVTSDSLQPCGLYPTRILCPWDFPGKNTGVGCLFLLKGIFLDQKSKPGVSCCRQILYSLSHQGSQAERMIPQRVLGPTVRSQLSYRFPKAVVTKHHRCSGSQQQEFIPLLFWRLEV